MYNTKILFAECPDSIVNVDVNPSTSKYSVGSFIAIGAWASWNVKLPAPSVVKTWFAVPSVIPKSVSVVATSAGVNVKLPFVLL